MMKTTSSTPLDQLSSERRGAKATIRKYLGQQDGEITAPTVGPKGDRGTTMAAKTICRETEMADHRVGRAR